MATTVTLGTGSGGVGTGTTGIKITFSFTQGATTVEDYELKNANSPLYVESKDLVNGFNQITVPTKAGGVVFIPPSANSQTLTLKGITGDTGTVLSKTGLSVLSFDSTPPANFGITTNGAVNGCKFVWF